MSLHVKTCIITGMSILCCVNNVFALSAAEQTEFNKLLNMSLEELLDTTIISSASKYTQKISEAPASVNVLTAEDIRRYGYRTLAELLGSIHGFFTYSDNIRQNVGVRGFLPPGDSGKRLLVLVDGHNTNDSLGGYIGLDRGFVLDLDLIQRVEVVHGPSSSLYGNGAFFAVVNLITKRGAALDGAEISAELANDQRLQGRFSYGKLFDNGLDLLVSATKHDYSGTDKYYPFYDNPEFSPDGIAHERDFEDADSLFAKVQYGEWTLNSAYVKWNGGMGTPFSGDDFDSPSQFGNLRAYLGLSWQHSFSETFDSQLSLAYDYVEYDGAYYFGDVLATDDSDTRSWSAKWQWQWRGEKNRWVGGVDFQSHQHNLRKNMLLPVTHVLGDTHDRDNEWSAYLQDEITLNDKFTLNAGVRYDHYDLFGGTTHPRLALIYTLNQSNTLKLLAGSAFRAPTAYESKADDSFFKPNPNLEAETIQAYEAVWEHYFSADSRAIFSAYRYTVENLLTMTEDVSDELWYFDNLVTLKGQGVNAEFTKNWRNGLNLHLAYTYQEIEDANGENLAGTPRTLIKGRVGIPLYKDWVAGLELRYRSNIKSYKDPSVSVDGFTQANLTLSGTLMKNLTLSASVYNLFGTDYVYALGAHSLPDRYTNDDTSFRVKLTYEF